MTTTWDGQAYREVLHHELAHLDGSDWPRWGQVPWALYTSEGEQVSEGSVTWTAAGELIAEVPGRNLRVVIRGVWLSGMSIAPTVRIEAVNTPQRQPAQRIWRRVRSWRRGRRTTLA